MRKVKISIEDLIEAFENCSLDVQYFLDMEKGEVEFIGEFEDQENREEFYEKIDSNSEKYLSIPEKDSREEYHIMVDFVNNVKDKILQDKLAIALDGKGAFGRFKRVLSEYPKEREKWFEYKDEKSRELVEEWLQENELELG